MFFIVPGLMLFAAGGALVAWSWVDRERGGSDLHLLGEIGMLLGVLMCSMGIMALQAKRYFEELFHLGTSILREVREHNHRPDA